MKHLTPPASASPDLHPNPGLLPQLRRLAVEALCLLMLLYGAPLQALESTLPEVEAHTPEILSNVEAALASAREELYSGLQTARQATNENASSLAQQPWTDALSLMLTASSFGAVQETSAPPSPPSEDRSTKAYDLASLAQAFQAELGPNKDALDAIPLLPGWNQISLPEVPGTSDPATVLAAIGGSYSKVYAYDGCDADDPWKIYDPVDSVVSDLTSIDVTQGLLVDATAAIALPSDGTLPDSTTFQLCTGWNLIGFPSAQPRHVRSALAPIMDKVVRVFGFDPFDIEDPWAFFEKDAPAWASDLHTLEPGMGYWILVTEDVQLEIKNVGDAPDIAFTSPLDLDVVTAPTEIHGRVASDLLESWQLRYRGVGEPDWVNLASGTYPVDGRLGEFDPTLLLNGMYELELVATDLQGLQVTDSIAIVVEGNMKIGHFTLSFVDLAIPLSGLDIEVVRTYDSRQRHLQGDFGYGWSLDIRQGSYRNNRPPGDGWVIHATEGPWGLPCSRDAIQETKSHLTTIRLSDQEVYRFKLVVEDPGTIIGGCIGRADFEFIDGPIPGASLEILGNTSVLYQNNSGELRDPNSFELFVPEDVKLTTRDGRIFHLDLNDGVTHLEDLNGNTLDITPEGITHSSGRGVEFVRDAEGRIERIIDPMGNANVYGYDGAGDLVRYTDRVEAETRHIYTNGHYLIDYIDPLGNRALRNDYDSEGRLIRHTDAQGKVFELTHDLANRREITTNRLGNSRILEYDERGNIVREIDALGAVTERTFDARDNLLSIKNPLGHTTVYTYSSNNDLLTVQDPLGRITSSTYDSRGRVLTETDAKGNVSSSTYDAAGNLLSETDALNQMTSHSYDETGNLVSTTDPLGHVQTYTYDAVGNLTSETDALGHTTTYAYDVNGNRVEDRRTRSLDDGSEEVAATVFSVDALGRVVATEYADGSINRTVYGLLGRAVSSTDPLGRVTTQEYDAMGRPQRVTYPDGSTIDMAYDAEGQMLTRTDAAGHVTSFTYDAVGRLLTTTFPDGAVRSQTYDLAGQPITSTDALGLTTRITYDAAGQRTRSTDALDQTTTFAFDANGNQISVTDSLGRTTNLAYDELDRQVRTLFPDGAEQQVEYDALGRTLHQVDEEGRSTHFAYDARGHLAQITDATGGITRHAYNELGNRIAQTDANGNTTRFEYDVMQRQTARVLPGGARETKVYGLDGAMTQHTDALGHVRTFEYDALGRLLRREASDGTDHRFTYTVRGLRATATDARGTTRYTYDTRRRLIEKEDPNGHRLNYSYDLEGNTRQLTATVGAASFQTAYTYDSLERLASVTDPQGRQTSISYDAVGNRTQMSHGNGLTTTYSHDTRRRLNSMETRDGAGQLLQSYNYTLSPTGQRTRVDEVDGTARHYTYDALYRLRQGRVLTGTGELLYQLDFDYDPVGNRLEETFDAGQGTSIETSSYDTRDRLLTQGASSLSWDSHGHLVGRDGQVFTWNADHRLTTATLENGGRVEYLYDIDGHRVQTRFIPNEGEPMTLDYLVDTRGFLSQVVAEVVDGVATAVYTRAHNQLLSLLRPVEGTSRTYLPDGLGSIRALADAAGSITDRYDYNAFGELLDHVGSDTQPYRFAGEPYDPNLGFYYNRARWMDPSSGRFLSPDPFVGSIRDPGSLHKYSYAHQRPTTLTDPTGLISTAEVSVAQGVRGELGAIHSKMVSVVNTLNRVQNFVDMLETFHSLFTLLAGPGDIRERMVRELKQLNAGGLRLDFGEILEHLVPALPQIAQIGFTPWSRWLLKSGRAKKIKGYAIYLPSLPTSTGGPLTLPGISWRKREIKFVTGGFSGRVMGLGLFLPKLREKISKTQQIWRMDYHDVHDFNQKNDIALIASKPYHFHVRQPGHKK